MKDWGYTLLIVEGIIVDPLPGNTSCLARPASPAGTVITVWFWGVIMGKLY